MSADPNLGILTAVAYRGVLLDFYGTVVEEDDAVVAGIVRRIVDECAGFSTHDVGRWWAQEFAASLSEAHGTAFRHQRDLALSSLKAVLERVGAALDPVELLQAQFAYWRRPALRPGAVEFISSCPVPICVVSNIDTDDLHTAIVHHGLTLPLVTTSEEVRSYKPRAELFVRGLELLGLDPDEVLHVGDSLSADIRGADALDISAVWVNTKSRPLPDGVRLLHQVTDLRDLIPLLGAPDSGSRIRVGTAGA